jgi:hypothetical protein
MSPGTRDAAGKRADVMTPALVAAALMDSAAVGAAVAAPAVAAPTVAAPAVAAPAVAAPAVAAPAVAASASVGLGLEEKTQDRAADHRPVPQADHGASPLLGCAPAEARRENLWVGERRGNGSLPHENRLALKEEPFRHLAARTLD